MMSQVGEAHKAMMRMMEWGIQELQRLAPLLLSDSEEEDLLEAARFHFDNALEIATSIDSGTVYRAEGKE